MKFTTKIIALMVPLLTTACGDMESSLNGTESVSHNVTHRDVPANPVSEFDRIKNLPSTYRGRPQVTNNQQNVRMALGPCVEVFSWMTAHMKANDCARVSAPRGILFAVSQCITYIPADEIGRLCQDLRFNGDMAKMGEAYMYGYAAALYLEAAQNR